VAGGGVAVLVLLGVAAQIGLWSPVVSVVAIVVAAPLVIFVVPRLSKFFARPE
jgi:hypothetical protein